MASFGDILTASGGGLQATAVAPQVVRHVACRVGGDREALAQTLARLSGPQLAGRSMLPDPLPPTPAVRAAVTADVGALDDEARQVLLAASVLVLDRVDVLLGATGVAVDRLLAPPLVDRLELADGRFRCLDPRVRAVVHEDADLAARTAVHAALAVELERVGEERAARWHAALATLAGDPALAPALVGTAGSVLGHGDAEAAHAIAREAASHGTGEVRARAFLVAGQAALFSGHLDDAAHWLERVASTGVQGVREEAELARDAVRSARAQDPGAQDPGAQDPPGMRLARLVVPVARAAVSEVDRAVLIAVVDALARLEAHPRDADAVLARAVVTAAPARDSDAWARSRDVLSPLAEAHLRVAQALVLLRCGDVGQASRVLSDAADRLPVTAVAGGLAAAVARGCGSAARGLVVALEALGPVAEPAAAAAGPRSGAPLVTSAVRACATYGPQAGGDVWSRWADVLTARELDVARLVAQGLANKQVASRLCVSVRTVEVHLGRVYRKVGVNSRAELTVLALRSAA